jgi:hypothetical protein
VESGRKHEGQVGYCYIISYCTKSSKFVEFKQGKHSVALLGGKHTEMDQAAVELLISYSTKIKSKLAELSLALATANVSY